jgi:tetratricopeptide (TPR) repeat protein
LPLTKLKKMATYNKRGYKTPKAKEENDDLIENVIVDEKDSTTAGVFNSLDKTASKTEEWIAKNQKVIFGVVAVIALITVGYVLFQKFVAEPKEDDAADQMFVAQQNFQKATDGVKSDSLYNLSLKGSEGKFGFIDIAEKYSGTDAGNLANYYAGMAYLNTGKYLEAIKYLEKFNSKDVVLSTLAIGAIGDAYAQQNNQKEALSFYVKASESNKNDFTTPRFLLKAGRTALTLGNKADALKYFTEIKEKYEASPEAGSIDALIGLAQ